MGWTYRPKPQGKPEDYLPAEFFADAKPDTLQAVVRVKCDLYDALYLAVKLYPPQSDRVVGYVVLLDEGPQEIGYKIMCETEGPVASSAPVEVLEKLTDPAPNEWAFNWRRRCWLKAAGNKAQMSRDPDLAYVP